MADRSPFDFDMRVSADKKRRGRGKRGMSGAFETSQRVCDKPGCNEAGQYRAPKSPDLPDEYFWFCKTHVREYNLSWNYFHGQSDAEFSQTLEQERVWGRATRPFGDKNAAGRAWERLGIDDPHAVLGDKATQNPGKARSGTRRLPPTERRALEILEGRDDWTRAELRSQYKSLVKDLHPDKNGGTRADEDRLQEVVWAWDQIKESRNFRD